MKTVRSDGKGDLLRIEKRFRLEKDRALENEDTRDSIGAEAGYSGLFEQAIEELTWN